MDTYRSKRVQRIRESNIEPAGDYQRKAENQYGDTYRSDRVTRLLATMEPEATVSVPEATVSTSEKKKEKTVLSPGGTFLGGMSYYGTKLREKTPAEKQAEERQQAEYLKEYQRLLNIDTDALSKEVAEAKEANDKSRPKYQINALSGYDSTRKTEEQKIYSSKLSDLNKAKTIQYEAKGAEALEKLSEADSAAVETLATERQDSTKRQAAWQTLQQSGHTDDEISQLINYQRNIPKRQKNAELYSEIQDAAAAYAETNPGLATLASVPANLVSGAGTVDAAVKRLSDPDSPTDYKSAAMLPYAFSSTARGTVSENLERKHGKAASFLYGVGTSIADSAATAGLALVGVPAGLASATLGGAAATDAMVQAKERGLSDNEAIVSGVAAGVFETLFEKVSLDSLITMKAPTGSFKQKVTGTLKNSLKQAGIEGSEELATSAANLFFDHVAHGQMSDAQQRIYAYMAQGMDYTDAKNEVEYEILMSMAQDFAAGALAGGLMGGSGSAVQALSTPTEARQRSREKAHIKGEYKASETGKTTYNGKEVSIDGVDAEGNVLLSSGESVKANEVEYSDRKTAEVYEGLNGSETIPAAARGAIARSYEGKQESDEFVHGMEEAYRAGSIGIAMEDMNRNGFNTELTETQKKLAYDLGAAMRKEQRTEKAALSDGGIVYEEGIDRKKLTKMQKDSIKVAEAISKAVGGKVHLYSTTQNAKGIRTADQQNIRALIGEDKAPNGFYDHKTGDIYLDINSGNEGEGTMLYTLAHEYTHMMRQNAKESFDRLTELLFQKYRENGDDVDALILAKQDRMGTDYDTAFEEFVADSMEAMLTDTNAAERIAGLKETDKTAWEKLKELVHKLLESIRGLYEQYSPSSVEGKHVREMGDALEKLSDLFVEGMGKVGEQGASEGKISYQARVGTDENTGKPIYQSNFPKGTPKADKAQRILSLIQNVWSKKPISLVAKNDDGSTRTIKAQFDPTFDNSGNSRTDASKLMGGNRHGSAAEQRVTLDLADDYYEIATESTYNYSKDETGKENATHRGVNQWHYFINDILFQEYGEKEATPYRVTINVKERSDGEFVYSFSAERQNERPSTRRTLHADVNQADITGKANAQPSENNVPQQPPVVKKRFSMQERYQPKSYAEAEKEQHVSDAKAFFGKTYRWNEAGYVTTDGTKLDFSGRHEGASGGYRTVDHRDIRDAIGDEYGGEDYSGAMIQFMSEGNIRISPESGGINLSVMPTKAQFAAISDYISRERGEVVLDIDDLSGNTVSSTEYPRGTHSNKVINDIKAYFETGAIPRVSELGQFRYQERGTSNREILTTALESAAQNPREREVLAEYKAAIDTVNEYEERLAKNKEKLKELSFATDKRDKRQIDRLKNDIRKDENRISRADKTLLQLEATESLKNLLDREKARLKKREQKKLRDAVSDVRELERNRDIRKRIEKHSADLSRKLLRPTDKQHIPESLRQSVAALLNSINTESSKGKDTKRTQAAIELKQAYKDVLNSGDTFVIDPDLLGDEGAGLLDTIQTYGDKPIADMTSAELATVWKAVRAIEKTVTTYNKLLMQQRYESIPEQAEAFKSAAASRRRVNRTFSLDLADPYTFFSAYGEGGMTLYRELRNAQDQQNTYLKSVQADVDKFSDKKVFKGRNERHTFTTEDGHSLTLTTGQVMNLYNLINRGKQATNHLMVGGIVQPAIKRNGKQKTIDRGTENIRLTTADMKDITDVLTDEQKAVAEGFQKVASGSLAKWGNDASMLVYGYNKFTEKNYWPIKSAKEGTVQNSEKGADVSREIKNMGSAKALTPNASNPLDIGDVYEVFAQNASDMIQYSTLLAPMEDANRLFNYRYRNAQGVLTGKNMKNVLTDVYGDAAQKYWRNLMRDVQNGLKVEGTDTTRMVEKLVGGTKAASVGFNLRVVMQQPTAYVRAAAVISPADMAKGIAAGATKGDGWDKARKYAPIASIKDTSGFDQSSRYAIAQNIYPGRDGIGGALDKLNEASGYLAGKADAVTWGKLWNACEWATVREGGYERGSNEFYKRTAEIFTDVIDQSQVVDGVLQRSQIMRDGNGLTKQATAFMGEPIKALNMFLRAYDSWRFETDTPKKRDAMAKLRRTIGAVLVTDVLNAMVQSIMDAFRDDDKDKNWLERYLTALTGVTGEEDTVKSVLLGSNIWDNIDPIGRIPYAKDVKSIMQGYSVTRMDADTVSDFINAAQRFVKASNDEGQKTTLYATKQLLTTASKMFGVSVANVGRDVWAIARSVAQETGNVRVMYEMEKAIWRVAPDAKNNSRYYALLFKAAESDKETYDHIYNDLISKGYSADQIKSGVKGVIKDSEMAETDMKKLLQDIGFEVEEAADIVKEWDFESTYGYSYKNRKEAYAAGAITKSQLVDAIVDIGGKPRKEAEFEATYGYSYGSKKDAFLDGAITKERLVNAIMDIDEKSREDAEAMVTSYEFERDGIIEKGRSVSAKSLEMYEEYGSGIKKETFFAAISEMNAMKGEDYDGDGESDMYSKVDKQLAYIDEMALTDEQKRAMALAAGISQRTIAKRAPF